MLEEGFDKYDMRRVILEYPNQLSKGKEFVERVDLTSLPRKYSNLIICGMGGSGHPGELLNQFLNSRKRTFSLPLYVQRTYNLPRNADENSLIFISSYSGNTEETISCFQEALEKGATIVSFAAGGKVEELSKKNSIPFVKYTMDFEGFQPRYALTYALVAMNEVLTKLSLSDTVKDLPKLSSRDLEISGEEIAKRLKGKTPIIYASNRFKIGAKMLKIKINENAKTPAFWNYFPELSHNEMVGFTNPQGNFYVLMFEDEDDHPQIRRRIGITKELYEEKGLEAEVIKITGESYLEKILNVFILGDWISYYLAYEYKQDPTPVDMVEDLKKKLA
ncbi:bifunctional phosphoglucose/phosphomannose isomerase [bacterium]|jgi:glucose/mannose-6-phosphate isomerase|nr:bifunctional phosphoglucose/phosphomannose isomerase [bacterium]MBT4251594.1 bifunctional phosphoglucose/phosphomannose isomerase [bacterium]MBT4597643.1 bifunctional phosphoglucose/phosphomannose isomerase [bacterium]MBT6753656.1 bifunctional phosphoglucose/phosphomannose isomerase [bacterium]MBT7037793.1 bifunctional phosphoglucose/phosphomannose isomerase [bacterium]